MKTFAAILLAAVVAFGPALLYGSDAARHKVVIQVSDNDPAKWNLALNVAENLQQTYGKDNVDVEIAAYGPGLNMFRADSKVAARLNKAQDSSVGLYACENTMKKMKITKADLQPGAVVAVGGGVVHIFKRQKEGWDSIRP